MGASPLNPVRDCCAELTGATAPSPSKDACSQPHKAVMQGCIKTATQSRCMMQRHKWLSMHRCSGTNGCRCTDATTQTTANARMRDSACPKFRTMRNQQSKHDSTTPPHYTFVRSTSGVLFLVRREGELARRG